jgi:hypothetical protein
LVIRLKAWQVEYQVQAVFCQLVSQLRGQTHHRRFAKLRNLGQFTQRLQSTRRPRSLCAGTGSRPHYRPNDRYIVVISGTWWLFTLEKVLFGMYLEGVEGLPLKSRDVAR